MSSRSMSLDVLVRLRDQLTGPLRRLRDQLKSLSDFARKIGLLGAAIAAISFMGPIKEAAAFQQKLLDIAGTIDLSGKKAFEFVDTARTKFEALALASGQASDIIAAGAGKMIAAGVDRGVVDASISDIAMAATAANAVFEDMADVATTSIQTLNVPTAELKDNLGALVVAGKLGAFELKDMAKYFPNLASGVTKFGVKSREAVNFLGAALQIARKGTSDPAEAANNLSNFLNKIMVPATIKNFKDAGVDIEAVMKDAATKGINPIEAVMQKIVQLTGISGDEIAKMMKKAQDQGLSGADALAQVREQITKIHGAGKLSEIFGDQQVMNFLIPFLANIDEYKRIKAEVAKATGAIIDEDAATQLAGLNRQLMRFQEIGTQASREVGFAFGEWLPWLNENLMEGLAWYRAWNKETGGLGTRLLVMAGGGILAATALGALGIALPVIGAGLGALLALLSPVGIALAAVAAGAVYLWRNWGTYGKRVMGYWESAKRGFTDFAEGVRSRVGRLLQAGRDIAQIFGPRIAAGLSSAWADIKGGWDNVKGFFDEIAKAANLKVDLSWLTIDKAEVVAIQAIEAALSGISTAWQAMKDFGSGFSLHLPDLGKDIGKTIKAFGEIADGIGRLAASLLRLTSLDMSKTDGMFKTLGDWMGKAAGWQMSWIGGLADDLSRLVNMLADLATWSEGKGFDWSRLVPGANITKAWSDLLAVLNAAKAAIAWFDGSNNPTPPTPVKVAKHWALDNAKRNRAMGFGGSTENLPGKTMDDLDIGNDNRPVLGRQQKVSLDGTVNVVVKVDGPGQVTSVTSTNKNIQPSSDFKRGRMVGGV
jgi:hypothetical protein